MYIPLLVANVFQIQNQKLKNVKRVCPRKRIEGQKE